MAALVGRADAVVGGVDGEAQTPEPGRLRPLLQAGGEARDPCGSAAAASTAARPRRPPPAGRWTASTAPSRCPSPWPRPPRPARRRDGRPCGTPTGPAGSARRGAARPPSREVSTADTSRISRLRISQRSKARRFSSRVQLRPAPAFRWSKIGRASVSSAWASKSSNSAKPSSSAIGSLPDLVEHPRRPGPGRLLGGVADDLPVAHDELVGVRHGTQHPPGGRGRSTPSSGSRTGRSLVAVM